MKKNKDFVINFYLFSCVKNQIAKQLDLKYLQDFNYQIFQLPQKMHKNLGFKNAEIGKFLIKNAKKWAKILLFVN